MKMFVDPGAIYLHRDVVDFCNYVQSKVMRSLGGERAWCMHLSHLLLCITGILFNGLQHRK